MAIPIHKGVIAIKAPSESAWRKWLIENHQQTSGVWLIIFKKDSKVDSINYDTAVDTAL
ncbi:YdeI/OmpD-associated family protein [Roseivirga misakiensis]|uniref:hypothetical protein n=1 Tax=Roseivirga misakiensis TaxID=1563681 RepID=UPI001FE16162|nr:hypothetical protein [Roseivirga misakiensis]